jgi:hypothetical protein
VGITDATDDIATARAMETVAVVIPTLKEKKRSNIRKKKEESYKGKEVVALNQRR